MPTARPLGYYCSLLSYAVKYESKNGATHANTDTLPALSKVVFRTESVVARERREERILNLKNDSSMNLCV